MSFFPKLVLLMAVVPIVCPKGGQEVAVWQGWGQIEISRVSWVAYMNTEKGIYDLGRTRGRKKERSKL